MKKSHSKTSSKRRSKKSSKRSHSKTSSKRRSKRSSKRSHSKKRTLKGGAKIWHSVARSMKAFVPSKTRDPADYKKVKAEFDRIRKTKTGASMKPIKAWQKSLQATGYGIPKKGTARYNAIKKEVYCRLSKSKTCKGVKSVKCRKYRRTCKSKRGSKRSSKRSTKMEA
jgi:hypothetical protein